MLKVVFPEPQFKIEMRNGQERIFDNIRKQWVILTEEEWVRQNFIRFLLVEMKYPETLIAVEKEIHLGDLKKRFDILVYDSNHKPWMLIECKAQGIKLDEKVFDQLLRYNLSMPCKFLVITNGQVTTGWEIASEKLNELKQFPFWRNG